MRIDRHSSVRPALSPRRVAGVNEYRRVAGIWVARVNEVAPWAPSAGSDGFEVVDIAAGWPVKAHAGRRPFRITKVFLPVFLTRVSGCFGETRAEVC